MSAWRDPVTLAGRHVVLRPLRIEDAEALGAVGRAIGIGALFYTTSHALERDPAAYVSQALEVQAAGRAMCFAVETPATSERGGQVVGMTRFMRMNEAHRRVEIGGTFYAQSVRRTGLNTEAKLLLLGHAFDVLGCNVVQIRTDWFNRDSQRAIERLGAKREGVLRGHQLLDGRVRDLVVYSILAAEWPGVRINLNHLLERHA